MAQLEAEVRRLTILVGEQGLEKSADSASQLRIQTDMSLQLREQLRQVTG